MIYPIVKYGDPVLEKQAETVKEFDTPELHKLLEDMFESMYAARGVGRCTPTIRRSAPHPAESANISTKRGRRGELGWHAFAEVEQH